MTIKEIPLKIGEGIKRGAMAVGSGLMKAGGYAKQGLARLYQGAQTYLPKAYGALQQAYQKTKTGVGNMLQDYLKGQETMRAYQEQQRAQMAADAQAQGTMNAQKPKTPVLIAITNAQAQAMNAQNALQNQNPNLAQPQMPPLSPTNPFIEGPNAEEDIGLIVLKTPSGGAKAYRLKA
jgi:hypothetical protein